MVWWLYLIIFLGLLLFGAKLYLSSNDSYWPNLGVPYVPASEIGSFWDRIRLPMHEVDNATYKKIRATDPHAKFGGIMELRTPVVMVTDLDLIKLITVKDFDHFSNRRRFGANEDPTLLHKMIFTLNGSEWKGMRSAISPTFTTGKIRGVFDIFNISSSKLADFLRVESAKDEVDMRDALGRYTMDVIASAAFGVDSQTFKDNDSIFSTMGKQFQAHLGGKMGALRASLAMMAPKLFSTLKMTFMDPVSTAFFHDVVRKTVRHRDTTGEVRQDFLQLIMDARDGKLKAEHGTEEGQTSNNNHSKVTPTTAVSKVEWDDDNIVAQSLTFFFGGFDTIEGLLTLAAYELAINPDVQEKLYEEVHGAVLKHGELTYEVINGLEYLDMVISETLRLHPPATRTERKCTKDYLVPDTKLVIKKDTTVLIPIWGIQHDPEYFPEPDRFLPERFSSEAKANRHPYAYLPFGVGPRVCIANRFAITEGKAAIAQLVHNFALRRSEKTPIPMKYGNGISLKPADGLWLNVKPRVHADN